MLILNSIDFWEDLKDQDNLAAVERPLIPRLEKTVKQSETMPTMIDRKSGFNIALGRSTRIIRGRGSQRTHVESSISNA